MWPAGGDSRSRLRRGWKRSALARSLLFVTISKISRGRLSAKVIRAQYNRTDNVRRGQLSSTKRSADFNQGQWVSEVEDVSRSRKRSAEVDKVSMGQQRSETSTEIGIGQQKPVREVYFRAAKI